MSHKIESINTAVFVVKTYFLLRSQLRIFDVKLINCHRESSGCKQSKNGNKRYRYEVDLCWKEQKAREHSPERPRENPITIFESPSLIRNSINITQTNTFYT